MILASIQKLLPQGWVKLQTTIEGVDEKIAAALYSKAQEFLYNLENEFDAALYANDSEFQNGLKKEKETLLSLFSSPIFAEAIPNGYSSSGYYRSRPWFKVTTSIGHFVIGWRKRVIEIDWKDTVGTFSAAELFPNEDVTKGEKSIHACSLEDATRYIGKIMESAKITNAMNLIKQKVHQLREEQKESDNA